MQPAEFAEFKNRLHGIWAFPVTPFAEDLSLDLRALEVTLAHLVAAGPDGVVAAGGSGEHYSLNGDEYRAVLRASIAASTGRAPVMAGVGGGFGFARDQARIAVEEGADAILALPPSYARPPDDGLVAYYRSIADASQLPLVLYTRDWAAYGPDLIARLANEIPAFLGLKDGQGDLRGVGRLRARVGERLAWLGGVGDDLAIGYSSVGMAGFTSSMFNFAPDVVRDIWNAAQRGDMPRARGLAERWVIPIYVMRNRRAGYEVSVTKAAMRVMGLPAGRVRPPLQELQPDEFEQVRRLLSDLPRPASVRD